MHSLLVELPLGAQTSYAELHDMAQCIESARFSTLRGSFHRRKIKNKIYVYFNFRDTDGRGRAAYVGPENERVRRLVDDFEQQHISRGLDALAQRAQACMALGCDALPNKHFRVIDKLARYGFFRCGGLLIGAYAMVAMGNMLGVRWKNIARRMEDNAHVCNSISVALPTGLDMSGQEAITSLENGLLPIREFSGRTNAKVKHSEQSELLVEFVVPQIGTGEGVQIPGLNVDLEPMAFTEFLLEDATRGTVFAKSGACLVSLPDPARFAVYNLIVHGERLISDRVESGDGLVQAAALVEWHGNQQRGASFREVWRNAIARGANWRRTAENGRDALIRQHPALAELFK